MTVLKIPLVSYAQGFCFFYTHTPLVSSFDINSFKPRTFCLPSQVGLSFCRAGPHGPFLSF